LLLTLRPAVGEQEYVPCSRNAAERTFVRHQTGIIETEAVFTGFDDTTSHVTHVRVALLGLSPSYSDELCAPFAEAWRAAANFFAARSAVGRIWAMHAQIEVSIRVDFSDIIDLLDRSTSRDLMHARQVGRAANGLHPLGCEIGITIASSQDLANSTRQWLIAERFLQQLFLALNLSEPGSCNLGLAQYVLPCASVDQPEVTLTDSSIVIEQSLHPRPPSLTASTFESARRFESTAGWPPGRSLTFVTTWLWLQKWAPLDLVVGTQPHHRALFQLLRASESESAPDERILSVVQGIEALVAERCDTSTQRFRQRIEDVLGVSPVAERGLPGLYNLRSRIVHGDKPMIRPGAYSEADGSVWDAIQYFDEDDFAHAVLVALVRDLVAVDARGYTFGTIVRRVQDAGVTGA
jgi:hypothetical protein